MRLIAINAVRGLLKIYFDASSPSVYDFKISRGAAGGGAHLSRSYTSEVAGGGTVVWGWRGWRRGDGVCRQQQIIASFN